MSNIELKTWAFIILNACLVGDFLEDKCQWFVFMGGGVILK